MLHWIWYCAKQSQYCVCFVSPGDSQEKSRTVALRILSVVSGYGRFRKKLITDRLDLVVAVKNYFRNDFFFTVELFVASRPLFGHQAKRRALSLR